MMDKPLNPLDYNIIEKFPRLRRVKPKLITPEIIDELERFRNYSAPALFNELLKEYNDSEDREFVPTSSFMNHMIGYGKLVKIYTMDDGDILVVEIKVVAVLKCGKRITIRKKIINDNGSLIEMINLEW